MCQYDTDAPAQAPFSPRNKNMQDMKFKKGYNSHNN